MEKDLVSTLYDFLKGEKIKMKLQKVSTSEFWLESQEGFLAIRFFVKADHHEIVYDVFSPKYDIHLKVETLRDVEKLDRIVEETGKWEYERPVEDFWLILDCVTLWAEQNGFRVKETRLI